MNIEKRIRYFLKNYEYDEKGIIKEISSQFNLTDAIALQKIRDTRDRSPFLKKARNILKKFENIPRAKPSGVEVDIQGKTVENYKIRISGARSQWQLNQILKLMNIILYLYVDVYHHKNPDRKEMITVLKSLNNISLHFYVYHMFVQDMNMLYDKLYLSIHSHDKHTEDHKSQLFHFHYQ